MGWIILLLVLNPLAMVFCSKAGRILLGSIIALLVGGAIVAAVPANAHDWWETDLDNGNGVAVSQVVGGPGEYYSAYLQVACFKHRLIIYIGHSPYGYGNVLDPLETESYKNMTHSFKSGLPNKIKDDGSPTIQSAHVFDGDYAEEFLRKMLNNDWFFLGLTGTPFSLVGFKEASATVRSMCEIAEE